MDQVKEFLRQCVKYRFWISLGVASLFSVIAYYMGAGPVREKATSEGNAIISAEKSVKQFASPGIPNDQYKPIVDAKTAVLTQDVNKAWKDLYSRQAPLLNWPEPVEKRFQEWGRTWPENVAESAVQIAIVDYIEAYPKYVENVYKSFQPFDFETGKGIVSAPPKEGLLRPQTFDINKTPELGEIWDAQETLWTQRTVLEVVSQVNRNATDWDSAIIKQINALEVGNNAAQDQYSFTKGEELTKSEAIRAPGAPDPEEEEASGGGASQVSGKMGGMFGGGMMGGGGGQASDGVYYIKPPNDNGQFKILPIMLTVLIDQQRVQDLLVELENSPMSIQVMDVELKKPEAKITKPVKGESTMGGYGGMMGGYGGMMGLGKGMGGYGGMASSYNNMMRGMMGGASKMGGMAGMGAGGYSNMTGGYGGMMGGGTGAAARQGTDKRSEDRSKAREDELKAAEEATGVSLFDPYFNIVEVTVYGQARFYSAPSADAVTEESPGEVAATPAEDGTTPPAAENAAEPAKTEPAASEPAKTEADQAAEPAKAEPEKTEEPAKTEPAASEPASTEPEKTAEPEKTETPASEPAAPETPKP